MPLLRISFPRYITSTSGILILPLQPLHIHFFCGIGKKKTQKKKLQHLTMRVSQHQFSKQLDTLTVPLVRTVQLNIQNKKHKKPNMKVNNNTGTYLVYILMTALDCLFISQQYSVTLMAEIYSHHLSSLHARSLLAAQQTNK